MNVLVRSVDVLVQEFPLGVRLGVIRGHPNTSAQPQGILTNSSSSCWLWSFFFFFFALCLEFCVYLVAKAVL